MDHNGHLFDTGCQGFCKMEALEVRILVTGATGFLGTNLTRTLQNRGNSVFQYARVDRVPMGLDSSETVVHLAAQTEVGRAISEPTETFHSNIQCTWQLLDWCRKAKPPPRVIVASSDKAYGRQTTPYHEDMLPHADRPYEVSKVCQDLLAQTYAATYNMNVAITRCGNLYGPSHLNWTTLIPGSIRSILKGERPIIRSDGSLRRDYLFIDDAVDGYSRLIESDYKGAVNFGTGVSTSATEVVEMILELMKSKLKPDVQNNPIASHEILDQRLDCSLAAVALNWKPKYSLKDGLAKTIDWYRSILK